MALVKCSECGEEISSTAQKCPHCGVAPKNAMNVTLGLIVIVSILSFLVVAFVCTGIFISAAK